MNRPREKLRQVSPAEEIGDAGVGFVPLELDLAKKPALAMPGQHGGESQRAGKRRIHRAGSGQPGGIAGGPYRSVFHGQFHVSPPLPVRLDEAADAIPPADPLAVIRPQQQNIVPLGEKPAHKALQLLGIPVRISVLKIPERGQNAVADVRRSIAFLCEICLARHVRDAILQVAAADEPRHEAREQQRKPDQSYAYFMGGARRSGPPDTLLPTRRASAGVGSIVYYPRGHAGFRLVLKTLLGRAVAAALFAVSLPRQSGFDPLLRARLHVIGVPLNVLNDVFLQDLTLETPQRALYCLAFQNLNFGQRELPSIPGPPKWREQTVISAETAVS